MEEDLSCSTPYLPSAADFDLDESLLDGWDDGMDVEDEDAPRTGAPSARRVTIAQQMKKAGYTVDVLKEEDLERAQAVYDRLTYDHVYKERKRPRYKDGIPRIMRNDIRWSYPQMFMNAVNSGDFVKMASFFHTFMTKPCKFIVDHEIDPCFSIPHRLLVQGPKLMAHYLQGAFVIFPDLVLTMTGSRIVSSRGWTGSKIIIDLELKSTKLYDLSLEPWVPQVKYLARYQERNKSSSGIADARVLEEGEIPPSEFESAPARNHSVTSVNSGNSHNAVKNTATTGNNNREGLAVQERVSAYDPSSIASTSCSSDQAVPTAAPRAAPTALAGLIPEILKLPKVLDISQGAETDYVSPEDTEIRRKGYRYRSSASSSAGASTKKHGATEGEGDGQVGDKRKHTGTHSAGTDESKVQLGDAANVSSSGAAGKFPRLSGGLPSLSKMGDINPDVLIKALFASARLHKTPQFLHAKGHMTLFLDANNNMQHINLVLAQQRGNN
jgi:hypothetical protein